MNLLDYADAAVRHVERRALYAHRVDWLQARAALRAAAGRARTPADLHGPVRSLVQLAGGPHSGLLAPGAGRVGDSVRLPHASVVAGTAVLVLPTCDGPSARAYAVAGGRELRRHARAGGWVLDLRGNAGGSMWPMLAVAAPLLGSGTIGAFVGRDGARTPWWVLRRWVGTGRRPRARSRGPAFLPGSVAVLTDGRTASAAEAVAVAFRGAAGASSYGAATCGLTTGNEVVRLSDGALLCITSCRLADRTGTVYDGPLLPDVPAADPLTAALHDAGRS